METTAVSPAEIDAFLAELCGWKGVKLGWCSTEPECGSWQYDPSAEHWPEADHYHAQRELKPVALHQYDNGEQCVTGEAHTDYCYVVMDAFTESLDALFAPGGPVEKCRERGLRMSLGNKLGGEEWCAHMGTDELRQGEFDVCLAPTPALALAEACYKALK